MTVRTADSRHRCTLQISAYREGTCIGLLQFSDGSINIELTDVADYQSPNAGILSDATDDCR